MWKAWLITLLLVGLFAAVGLLGLYRYLDNYWLYRGFAPPRDAPFVRVYGKQETISVVSLALGGGRNR